jgi:hypothetical protein
MILSYFIRESWLSLFKIMAKLQTSELALFDNNNF